MENFIVIGFSKAKGFDPSTFLIRKLLRTPFSHVYIKLYTDKYDRDLIYQASGTMVNFIGIARFNSHHVVVDEFKLSISDETKTKIMQFAIDQAGTPYGLKQAFGMGLVKICALFGKKIRNPFRDNKQTYVCSELVGHILIDLIGIKLDVNELDDITPADIYNYLIEHTDKI